MRGRAGCTFGERTWLSCDGDCELRSGLASRMRRKRQSSGCFSGRLGRFKRFSVDFNKDLCACILDSVISCSMSSIAMACHRALREADKLSVSSGRSSFHFSFHVIPA